MGPLMEWIRAASTGIAGTLAIRHGEEEEPLRRAVITASAATLAMVLVRSKEPGFLPDIMRLAAGPDREELRGEEMAWNTKHSRRAEELVGKVFGGEHEAVRDAVGRGGGLKMHVAEMVLEAAAELVLDGMQVHTKNGPATVLQVVLMLERDAAGVRRWLAAKEPVLEVRPALHERVQEMLH
ncbi:MAG: hypothetical protein IT168_22790 [Bryobacterales bacterium]|nr:hypothetical protein [Bryobacterales bacterium]